MVRAADVGVLLGITAGLKKQREIPEGSLTHLGNRPRAERGSGKIYTLTGEGEPFKESHILCILRIRKGGWSWQPPPCQSGTFSTHSRCQLLKQVSSCSPEHQPCPFSPERKDSLQSSWKPKIQEPWTSPVQLDGSTSNKHLPILLTPP